MQPDQYNYRNSKKGKLIFYVSIIAFLFWLSTRAIDVYHFAFVGVIFEILWLPMLAVLFILPIVSWIYFWKEKFNTRSWYFYSLLIIMGAILIVMLPK